MEEKKKKTAAFPKPPFFLYYAAIFLLWPIYKLKYGMTVDKTALKGHKGPALILSPHISGKDHVLHAFALFPIRPTFVLSEHFMAKRFLRPVLKRMHIITKKMFSTDVGTILNILRAKKAGNTIVLFPEGRLTWIGHSGPITEGTAELVKKLCIPVFSVVSSGAYFTFPKWGLKRKGKIQVKVNPVLSPEAISKLSVGDIESHLSKALKHTEEASIFGVPYHCKDTTEGLNNILYLCPQCHSLHSLTTQNGHITCSECSLDASLDEYYKLSGCAFHNVDMWYDWEKAQLDPSNDTIACHAKLNATNEKGYMVASAGEADILLNASGFSIKGTLFKKPYELFVPSQRLPAFPVTPGHHFDIYDQNRLINVLPEDGRDAIRFVTLCDVIREAQPKKDAGSN